MSWKKPDTERLDKLAAAVVQARCDYDAAEIRRAEAEADCRRLWAVQMSAEVAFREASHEEYGLAEGRTAG